MRTRALALLFVAVALCVAAILYATRPAAQPARQAAEFTPQPGTISPEPEPAAPPAVAKEPVFEQAADPAGTETEAVDTENPRVADVYRMVMRRDASAREALLAELTNPDPTVRRAALDGIIQLGDRSMIPRLREIEAATEDTTEKAEILEAINYIELPSWTEYLAQRGALPPSARTNVPRAGLVRPRPAARNAPNTP